MFYSVALMLLFAAVLLIFDHKSRYSWLFVLMLSGAMIAFFFMILHLNMFANYGSYGALNALYRPDWQVFQFITSRVAVPMVLNLRFINMGIAIYLIGTMLFNYAFSRELHQHGGSRRLSPGQIVLFMLVPLVALVLPDPSISTWMYLIYHKSSCPELIRGIYHCVEIGYKLLVLIFLLRPIVMLVRAIRKTNVFFLQRRLWMFAVGLLLANGIFFIFFYTGVCSISVAKVLRSGFWIFDTVEGVIPPIYTRASPLIFLVLSTVTFILLSFRMDVLVTPLTERKIIRNINTLNEVLGETLHSQKNLFFSMQILLGKVERKLNGAGPSELQRLQVLVDDSLDRVTEMLSKLKSIRFQYFDNDLLDIIDSAVYEVALPESVTISWDRSRYDARCTRGMYDAYCLEKALVNVLNNAVEAVTMAQRKEGHVQVDVDFLFTWIVISVTDNGCGITRKDRANIFAPHYSGKKGKMNCGLGLPYVYRVVKAHMGQIKVDSKSGAYTTVLILLPSGKQKKKGIKQAGWRTTRKAGDWE
ncbi:MAG: sensor histidine kinase [Eubacteriales bacterium]|nr:sensor histidine kinase [Eubacteriales bacterium]